VSLDWHRPRRWHAHRHALVVDSGNIKVRVRNRGQKNAAGVKVSVWYAVWKKNTSPPPWGSPKWKRISSTVAAQTVPAWPHPAVTFEPFPLPAFPSNTRLLILAAADCAADPANINSATGLPCANGPAPIIDLVAGDNNLGLRLLEVP
jgi:hypothetical protein